MLDWLFLVFSIKYCCPRCQAIEAARGSSAVLRVGKQSKTVKRKYKRPKYLRRPKADAGLGGEQDTTVAVKVPRCSQLFNRGTSLQPCPRQGPTTAHTCRSCAGLKYSQGTLQALYEEQKVVDSTQRPLLRSATALEEISRFLAAAVSSPTPLSDPRRPRR